MLTNDEVHFLIEEAKKAAKNSFLIESKAKGAALLTDNGEVYGGCIVQSTISTLGTCAESCAINHAVVHGRYKIKAMVTVSSNMSFPCGACLQSLMVMAQIDDRDIEIIAANFENEFKIKRLSQLLPEGYVSESKDREIKKYRNK